MLFLALRSSQTLAICVALVSIISLSCVCQVSSTKISSHSYFNFDGSRTINIIDFGAVAGNIGADVVEGNVFAFNSALESAQPGDTVLIPRTNEGPFTMTGPIEGRGLVNISICIEGHIALDENLDSWPEIYHEQRVHWLLLENCTGIFLGGGGIIDGNGMQWWDAYITGVNKWVRHHRPKLIYITKSTAITVEHLTLRNSPSFHLQLDHCVDAEVRFVHIDVDRFKQRQLKAKKHAQSLVSAGINSHRAKTVTESFYVGTLPISMQQEYNSWHTNPGQWLVWLFDQVVKLIPRKLVLQPEDLNTDGIDVSGRNIYVHDCIVNNDDDSVVVKPSSGADLMSTCSQDMVFQNLMLTGFGASIGSVPPHADVNCVRNITFNNVTMPYTGKGIYVKSNPSCGQETDSHGTLTDKTAIIEGILFQDITIEKPSWWSIWIGPQQQHEPGSPLDEKCALSYPISPDCPTQGCVTFANITLRNVEVVEPLLSPGVVLGNSTNPMSNIIFDNVKVSQNAHHKSSFDWHPLRGKFPWGAKYRCQNSDLKVLDGSSPVPLCDMTEQD